MKKTKGSALSPRFDRFREAVRAELQKTDPVARDLFTRMDVGNKLAEAMSNAGLTTHGMSQASGICRAQIWRTLGGDANLRLDSIVRMFAALGCRVDFVVTPSASDEWVTKRAIIRLEKRIGKDAGRLIPPRGRQPPKP